MNIATILEERAVKCGDSTAYTFLDPTNEESITYAGLDAAARRISLGLQSMVEPGERVILLYPPGLSFIAGLFACFYAGVIAVPAYPPTAGRSQRNLKRLRGILLDAQSKVALCNSTVHSAAQRLFETAPELTSLRWFNTEEISSDMPTCSGSRIPNEKTPAFLQYTSGSTAEPKGVIISHGNLIHNLELIRKAFGHSRDSRGMIWLPPYHDMGLIGGILQPLYAGFPVTLMAPTAFLQKPYAWLKAISDTRATTSGGPNSAYDLCIERVTEEQKATLDLRSWNVAFSGAEPVRSKTMAVFSDAFRSCGFRAEAFLPCYGLAEATLMVTGFRERGRNEMADVPIGPVMEAGCGAADESMTVEIVDPKTRQPVKNGVVGEIWVSGPSVACGYWGKPQLTHETFAATLESCPTSGPYLRTGDLGYLKGSKLHVTGRIKDIVIIRGLNYYPQDIELTTEDSHPAVRGGMGAAFAVESGGEERLVIVQEVNRHYKNQESANAVIATIRAAVAREHELFVHAVVLLPPGHLPKTSSGKVQRHVCRELFLKNEFDALAAEIFLQSSFVANDDLSLDALENLPIAQRLPLVEDYLRGLVSAILKVDVLSLSGEFDLYKAGLDSLMLLDFQHRVMRDTGVELPYELLYEMRDITQLSSEICRRAELRSTCMPAVISSGKGEGAFPLSYNQRALWFLHELAPDDSAYNIVAAARISGDLNREALVEAFHLLCQRHGALRMRFTEENGEPVQVTNAEENPPVIFKDASDWSEEVLDRQLAEIAGSSFDLLNESPARIHLLKRGARDHLLVWVTHHIVSDFWSFGILFAELEALYLTAVEGRPFRLEPVNGTYRDYVQWQSELLRSARGTQLRNFWKDRITDIPLLALPGRRNIIDTKSTGAIHDLNLPGDLRKRLRGLAARVGLTLNELLLASFEVLLHRLTGAERTILGIPSSGRSTPGFRETVGYFVNPLLIEADFCEDAPFLEFCMQVKRRVREAIAHQDLPMILILQEAISRGEREQPSGIQVFFSFYDTDRLGKAASFLFPEGGGKINWGSLTLRPFPIRTSAAQFELAVRVFDSCDQLYISWQYRKDLFEVGAAENMVQHWQNLLGDIVANPQRRISELEMLSREEKQQVLVEWNATRTEEPTDRCVHQWFEEQVLRTPDAVAVIFQDGQWTYQQLNDRANELAWRLKAFGLDRGKRAGICLERSPEMIAAIIAILKAGGAYVPLDPVYPQERLAFMASDARLSVVLTQRRFAKELATGAAQVLSVDEDLSQSPGRADNLAPLAGPGDLIYVVYTSGSTGQPKGAGVYHGGFTNLMNWFIREFSITAKDKILLVTSLSFDLTQKNLYAALVCGGELHLCPGGLFDPAAIGDWIQRQGITLLNCTPSAFYALLEHTSKENWRQLISLRHVFLGGEPISVPRVQSWLRSSNCRADIVNTYGPTECTDISCFHTIDAARLETYEIVPIGRPINNVQTFLLDEWLTPCPVGVIGEIYIGGCGVGAGYLKDPSLTAEKFVPSPFNEEGGGRLYRTGDLGRYLCNGNIEYVGRTDHQVKLRGFRIELGEIESCLAQHEKVLESVVVTHGDNQGNRRLTAYVVLRDGLVMSASELRNYLAAKLPDYMIPAAFTMMRNLPLTPSGKVDRNRLPAPDWDAACRAEYVAPRTPIEETLVNMWEEVLGQERIGIHDNFFHIGGNSLLMARITTRIRSELRVEIAMTKFFQKPTVAWVAEVIVQHRAEESNAGEINALLDQLESLSAEEVEERLERMAKVKHGV